MTIDNLITALVAGLGVFFVQRLFHKRDEKSKNILKNSNSMKILTNDIIYTISPQKSYARVREIIGGYPDKIVDDSSVFDDLMCPEKHKKNITSDIYFLKNAALKITTLDEKSIYSITVVSYDDTLDYPHDMKQSLAGGTKVSQEMITNAEKMISIPPYGATAMQHSTGRPFYKYVTYFIEQNLDPKESPDYKSLIGKEIVGFCLSDGDMAFYIYDHDFG